MFAGRPFSGPFADQPEDSTFLVMLIRLVLFFWERGPRAVRLRSRYDGG